MKRQLDWDPIRGVSCWWESDGASFRITHEQDVDAIIEANKQAANDQDKTVRGMRNDWWLYARIPTVIEMKWRQEYGVSLDDPNDRKKVFELLNRPEWRYLKTTSSYHG